MPEPHEAFTRSYKVAVMLDSYRVDKILSAASCLELSC